ncbi:MAG TPA: hypothetical protein VLA24_18090 [Pseudomonadales bacterium]|nr:hypothetical protein [Pseudomonadales bacterium]
MAFVIADRVKESSTTTGTGTYTLAGAEAGFQAFSAIGNGNTTYYGATDGTSWEVGIGTYTSIGTTLTRDTILSSSNSGNPVNWAGGTRLIFGTQPADKAVYLDANNKIASGTKFAGYIDLTPIDHPAHAEGRLFYDDEHKALNIYNDEADIALEIGQEMYVRVYNNSGATIENGKPVYFTGSANDLPTIALANATSADAYNLQGLATHDIENNSYGYITSYGTVRGFDTSGLTAGQPFFLGTTAGALQSTAAAYPNYPMYIGWVLTSSVSGEVFVDQHNYSVSSFRVKQDAYVGQDLTVGGDLTILGTQTIASTTNISIGGAFNYLNAGNTIGDANTIFTGSGVDDGTFTGHYTGLDSRTFYVQIDSAKGGTGGVDTFSWSYNSDMSAPEATGVDVNIDGNALAYGISIKFSTDRNHTLNDKWSGAAAPVNVDTGIFTNYNTGTTGVGYTHTGFFWDASLAKWTLLSEYDPEPEGTIDTGHASVSYATLKAGTFEGALTGNAATATKLATARTISLTGDASGSTTFDGTIDKTINVVVANDSHTHHTQYVQLSGSTMTGTLGATTIDFGDWTITESTGALYFAYQGTNKFKLDSTGTLAVTNDVLTDATIT